MQTRRTSKGLEVVLRPEGVLRFVGVAILSVWLSGWAVGELVALWMLGSGAAALVTGTPWPGSEPTTAGPATAMALFLVVWLAFWTLGGIAALQELARLAWSSDRLVAGPEGLRVMHARGPFSRARAFARASLRGLGLTRRQALVLWTDEGVFELSQLGTSRDRLEAAGRLRAEIALPEATGAGDQAALPDGWDEVRTAEGERALVPSPRRRRRQGALALAIASSLLVPAIGIVRSPASDSSALVFTGVLGALAGLAGFVGLRLLHGRPEWVLGTGWLRLQRRSGRRARARFEGRSLELRARKDSDGDDWFELVSLGASPDGRARSWSLLDVMNDETAPAELGGWLAREANMPMRDARDG